MSFVHKSREPEAPASNRTAQGAPTRSLRIGDANDASEREIDRAPNEMAGDGRLQRHWSIANIGMRARPQNDEEGTAQRKPISASSPTFLSEPGLSRSPGSPGDLSLSVYRAIQQPGNPLETRSRRHFEERFGRSFAEVRIHTGGAANSGAKSLRAAAYTVGNDIVFADGRFAPGSIDGRLLLQHELIHVEQQRSATPLARPPLDDRQSTHEKDARADFVPTISPLREQRIQCAPEDFSLGSGTIDTIGKAAVGDSAWPFLKAVFEGFVGGLVSDVQTGRADKAKEHLKDLLKPWNALKFYGGYLLGLVLGLISPITDLLKGVIGLAKLAISALEWLAKWSPIGVAVSPERQQKIQTLLQKFGALLPEVSNAIVEFARNPRETAKKFSGFLENMMQLALAEARRIGAGAAHSIFHFLDQPFFDMGESIGRVIGAAIANVLLLVFSDAIGNIIKEGASMVAKFAEAVAGKAVEIFQWVKSFAGKVIDILRRAVKGALKVFEGLLNKAIEAFDALKALFTEAAELDLAGEKALAGGGKMSGGPGLPNVMESRMVKGTRTAPARVEDLRPPKVHPSNVARPAQTVTGPGTTAEAVEDLESTTAGRTHPAGEAAAVGTEIEAMEVQQWGTELQKQGYRTYARNQFGEARIGPKRLSQMFTDQRARPDMIGINDANKTILVGDITANPASTAKVPGMIGQEEGLHIEKTIEYAKQLKKQLPPEFGDYKIFAQDRHWQAGGKTKLIEVK